MKDVIYSDLIQLSKVSGEYSLYIGTSKSKVILLGAPKISVYNSAIEHLGNNALETVSCAKNLGLLLDNKLRSVPHIISITGRFF